jgi:hypothetical protein
MRKSGDHRPDTEVKPEFLYQYHYNRDAPDLIFEDRAGMVAEWRRRGIRVAQVAEGNY